MRDLLLDPSEQAHYPNWEAMTECFIANLRQAVGTHIDDPRFIELTGEMSLASPRFRKLWAARHEVRAQYSTSVQFNHPQVGDLSLNRERLTIGGTDGLMLVIYHAVAASADAEKLSLLASADLPPDTPSTGASRLDKATTEADARFGHFANSQRDASAIALTKRSTFQHHKQEKHA